jgi:hypothetical protein
MVKKLIAILNKLLDCIGAQSLSFAAGSGQMVLSCVPTQLPAPASLQELFSRLFGLNYSPESGVHSIQIFWSGQDSLGRIGPCTSEFQNWTVKDFFPGAYPALFSIILEGEITTGPWLYALGVSRLYRNGHLLDRKLEFEMDGVRGQIINDKTAERLTLAWPGELIETSQAASLVVQLQQSHDTPDIPEFLRRLAESMRKRFLKTERDFSPDELRQAVDMDVIKHVVSRPQDLAALFGLGLQLSPTLHNPGDKWEVARYLLDPLVLPGFSPAACIESDLPITVESLASGWSRKAVPEIAEALPAKLARPSDALAVFLVEQIHAGEYPLNHLLPALRARPSSRFPVRQPTNLTNPISGFGLYQHAVQ